MAWNRSATLRADRAESTAAGPSGYALAARLLAGLAMVAVIGCASRSRGTNAEAAAATPPPPSSAKAARISAHVQEAAFTEDGDGARLVLSANAPLLYTAYEPRPDLLVVDLPGIALSEKFNTPAVTGSLVQSIRIEPLVEMGKQVTRLTIAHREGTHFDIRSLGQGLALSFDGTEASAAVVSEAGMAAAPAPSIATEEITRAPKPRGEPAHALEEIRATSSHGEVVVSLLGDGAFSPKTFALENPPRVVVDLPGVKNDVRKRAMIVKSDVVTRIRVSQFATSPEMITRIVLDLSRPTPHTVRADGERLAVVVGVSATDSPVAMAAPTPAAPAPSRSRTRTRTSIADAPRKPVSRQPEPVQVAVPAATEQAPAATVSHEIPPAEPVREAAKSETPATTARVTVTEPVPMHEVAPAPAAPVHVASAPIAPAPAPAAGAPARPAAPLTDSTLHARADEAIRTASHDGPAAKAPGGIKPSRKASRTTTAPARPATQREEALFEGAAAVLQQEDTGRPAGAGSPAQNAAFQPKTITEA
ncbi:MAG: AMIN domain-containing protein, partial [Acidobacteriota bacterium]